MTQKLITNNALNKDDRQKPLEITAPGQKAGFRVLKTVLWLMKHWFFKSSFVG